MADDAQRAMRSEFESCYMRRALELAERGRGSVEPNPLVGAVAVRDEKVVGEGWHSRFGAPHAEIEALQSAGNAAAGATLYVTLEPCCHQGKTPPCTEALVRAGLRRVVAAMVDPFPAVGGKGIAALAAAGIETDVGLLEAEARRLNAPYLKLVERKRPWIIAKWAMTLDGKIATRAGQSRWISGEESRKVVHELRGRVDAVLIGRVTAALDDPLLTARPPGPREAVRIVFDSGASLSSQSQLARTARATPVLVVVAESAAAEDRRRLEDSGCQTWVARGGTPADRLAALLDELGQRRMTNVLVEGGATLLGSLFDAGEVDETHVFIAPRIFGGAEAPGPVRGEGIARLEACLHLEEARQAQLGEDLYIHGLIRRPRQERG